MLKLSACRPYFWSRKFCKNEGFASPTLKLWFITSWVVWECAFSASSGDNRKRWSGDLFWEILDQGYKIPCSCALLLLLLLLTQLLFLLCIFFFDNPRHSYTFVFLLTFAFISHILCGCLLTTWRNSYLEISQSTKSPVISKWSHIVPLEWLNLDFMISVVCSVHFFLKLKIVRDKSRPLNYIKIVIFTVFVVK